MEIMLPTENSVVKKGEALLTARYQLSELAIKLIAIIYSGVKEDDPADKKYIIKASTIVELLGKDNKKIYTEIKNAVKEILKNPILIEDKDKKTWDMFNWVSGAKYKNGQISFYIAPNLKPYIIDIQKKYLKYSLKNILKLRGKYIIRTYEMLKNILNFADRYGLPREKVMSIEEFKKYIDAPESYRWGGSSGLKQRIVEVAKKQLKEKTDITFEYEELKHGKKVYGVKFMVSENLDNATTDKKEFPDFKEFVNLIREKYTGTGKYFGFKTINGSLYWLGIDFYGLMFAIDDNGNEKELSPSESKELYKQWYKIANTSKIYKDILSKSLNIKDVLQDPNIRIEFNNEVKKLKK